LKYTVLACWKERGGKKRQNAPGIYGRHPNCVSSQMGTNL